MENSPDDSQLYQAIIGGSFLAGVAVAVLCLITAPNPRGILEREPLAAIGRLAGFGLLSMVAGSFCGMFLKAFVFKSSGSKREWWLVFGISVGVSGVATLPFAALTFSR